MDPPVVSWSEIHRSALTCTLARMIQHETCEGGPRGVVDPKSWCEAVSRPRWSQSSSSSPRSRSRATSKTRQGSASRSSCRQRDPPEHQDHHHRPAHPGPTTPHRRSPSNPRQDPSRSGALNQASVVELRSRPTRSASTVAISVRAILRPAATPHPDSCRGCQESGSAQHSACAPQRRDKLAG